MTQALSEARVGLARQMERSGTVLSSALLEAFLNVPRHAFVPAFYRREGERFVPWLMSDDEAWLRAVYADDSLITEVDGVHAEEANPAGLRGVPTSSSTAPSLMADMLDALDVVRGSRVLEIGTGSGYNAALLSRMTEPHLVTTIDRSATLVDTARKRLRATLGPGPTVVLGDGASGVAGSAPYERIIATCSVWRIPPAWIGQLRTGGLLVTPLKGTLAGGMVARLTKLDDGTLAGRVMHTPAAFMPLISGPQPQSSGPCLPGTERPTRLRGSVLDDWTFSFFAQLHLPATTVRTWEAGDGSGTTTLHDPADGSYAQVRGTTVTTVGPRDLWERVEEAHALWQSLNRPRREWFAVESSAESQVMSYTAPSGRAYRWAM
ncbi:methyltransferase domain-containing protein [Streptomyces harbinensis]|uniref:protein-L-isoaspartate(D-aspartate) O-methyltransferase n=1 Tax=Streptomyces harbinensis TaxID=1176198 RepID=UPI0036B26E52